MLSPDRPQGVQDTASLRQERAADPQGFLERRVWGSATAATRAVGFRIFAEQLKACGEFPLRTLPALPDLKVIQLWRENDLARYLSFRQAASSGLWVETRPTRAPPVPLRVDVEQALRYGRAHAARFAKVAALFAPERTFRLSYEALARDWKAEMPRLFDFLGLPHHPVVARHHQQARFPARAVVLNYDELRQSLARTRHAQWLEPADRPAEPTPGTDQRPPVLCHLGVDDADLVPAFLAHYRALGAGHFHIVLHGPTGERAALRELLRAPDVTIEQEYAGDFSEQAKCDQLNRLLPAHRGRWVLIADADEFLELPYRSLPATLRALRVLRLRSLTATLVQRLAADGSLPALLDGQSPQARYPLGSVLLPERMNPYTQPWRNKVPLFLVQDDSSVVMGHHVSPTPDVSHSLPLRAVVHHFKWRRATLQALPRRRRQMQANGWEVDGYGRYLEANGQRLPLEGSFDPDRTTLFERGLLQRPDRQALRLHAALGGLRAARQRRQDPDTLPRLIRRIAALSPDPAAAEGSPLLGRQRRVCLVSFQLAYNETSAGIGTAVGAAAEGLALAGHEVTVVYAPLGGDLLHDSVQRLWHAQQVRTVSFPAQAATSDGGFAPPRLTHQAALWIAGQGFDLIHLHDCLGLGAGLAAARRAGIILWRTPLVVTVHGPTPWHRDGNALPVEPHHLHIDHAERLQIALADQMVTPSAWMRDWLLAEDYRLPAGQAVLPNLLAASARPMPEAAVRRATGSTRPIRELVFFGRLEPRKGLDSFCAAVTLLAARGLRPAKVTFLGRLDRESGAEELLEARHAWPFPSQVIEGYDSQTALRALLESEALAVIPSRRDNLPYTVYECLANGVPMIAAPVGGVPELVHPDDHGRVLVEPTAEALARAMASALERGFQPGRLAFSPDRALLDWLAWQERVVRDAPTVAPRLPTKAWWIEAGDNAIDVVLLDGGRQGHALGHALAALTSQVGQAARLYLRQGALAGGVFDGPAWPRGGPQASLRAATQVALDPALPAMVQANHLARAGGAPLLVFVGHDAELDQRALRVFHDALETSGADAVISAHEILGKLSKAADGQPRRLAERQPLAGPLALAASEDLFGVSCFALRRASFERLGGFREDPALGRFAAGELLARLLLEGGSILPLPFELYRQRVEPGEAIAAIAPDRPQRRRLAAALAPRFGSRLGGQLLRLLAETDQARPAVVGRVELSLQGILPDQDTSALLQGAARVGELSTAGAFRRVRAAGHARLEPAGQSLRVLSSGIDPILLLRGLRLPAHRCQLLVTCELDLEQSAVLQLFWQTAEQRSFGEARSQRIAAGRGRQLVRFVTPPIHPHGWLRLDPLAATGVATLHRIEVHAAGL